MRMIKLQAMRWAGHTARMGENMNAYMVSVGNPHGRYFRSNTVPCRQVARAPVAEGVATETSGTCYRNVMHCTEVTNQLLRLPLNVCQCVTENKSIHIFLLFNFMGITMNTV
jgi:hypothetical protein